MLNSVCLNEHVENDSHIDQLCPGRGACCEVSRCCKRSLRIGRKEICKTSKNPALYTAKEGWTVVLDSGEVVLYGALEDPAALKRVMLQKAGTRIPTLNGALHALHVCTLVDFE